MFKNKIVAAGLAVVLASPFGLAACGSKPAATEQSASSTNSAVKATEEGSTILYWEGALADGQSVIYTHDDTAQTAVLAIFKADGSSGKAWSGKYAQTENSVTISDEGTKEAVTLTVEDAVENTTSLKINITGYGEATLKPTTQSEFEKELEGIVTTAVASAATEVATEVADEASKTTFYWEGTLADGSTVDYMDSEETREALKNSKTAEASLTITKADLSDIKSWNGKATAEGDKITITDEESKQTISYTAKADGDSSLKLNIDGYGEVDLKPVTGGDIANEIGQAVEEATQSSSAK